MAPRLLVALLVVLVLAPAAQAQTAPQNVRAFLLRANEPEPAGRTFARTPAFAWSSVRGATRYHFQLSTSRRFTDNAIVWEAKRLPAPLTSIPLTLPWITGNPYSLYARVRAYAGTSAGPWSGRYGFRMRAPGAPASLSTGVNPRPGMIRWTPVEGATAYEVTFLYDLSAGEKKKIKSATTAADLREYYSFHNDVQARGIDQVSWRVRAVRELEGTPENDLPVVSYGPWSPTFVTQEPPTIDPVQIQLEESISRSGASGIVNTVLDPGPDPHELVPGFRWTGRYSQDGFGDCAALSALIPGLTCPLYHVYVYTDEDCVNRVHNSDLVGSPAYVPRLTKPLALPASPNKLAEAVDAFLPDAELDEGDVFDAGGDEVFAAGLDPSVPVDPEDEDLPEGEVPDRKSGIWDNDWPESRYYWTVVPAIPRITPDNTVEYNDVAFAEDNCQAGDVISFGKTSAPAIEKASGVPYVSGMVASGAIQGAQTDRPQFYGRVVVAWRPAPGATRYQVQWSRKADPFTPAGSKRTPSTSALLNLKTGVWYYRVRGIDRSLPTNNRGMSWTDAQYLKISPRTFTVLRLR